MLLRYSDMISKIQQIVLSGDNPVYGVACALAGILVVLALVKTGADLMNPEKPVSFWQISRPFVILVIVWNFTLVIGPINKITDSMASGITAAVCRNEPSFYDKVKSILDNVNSGAEAGKAEESSSKNSFFSWMGNIANSVVYHYNTTLKIKSYFMSLLFESVISLLVIIVRYVMLAVSGVYLAVLGILGPLVFALSLLPTFEQSLWQWLARYIQISLWAPLCSVINMVNYKAKNIMVSAISEGNIFDTAASFNNMIIIDLAILFMLFSVPSMANWIIQSSGAAGVHRPLARQAGNLANITRKVLTKGI